MFAIVRAEPPAVSVSEPVTLTVEVQDETYTYINASVTLNLYAPDGDVLDIPLAQIGTGRYQGTYLPDVTGTYVVEVTASKSDYASAASSAFFTAAEASLLLLETEGELALNVTMPITFSVYNEYLLPVPDATVIVSGTGGLVTGQTHDAGIVSLVLRPVTTGTVMIRAEKHGFASTSLHLPVAVISDTAAPALSMILPELTNQITLTFDGMTEPGVTLLVNDQAVTVDAQGRFTTTVSLIEGPNTLTAAATDAASNTTTVTRAVTLDTVPPALAVTAPREGLSTNTDVVTVTGSTEVTASLSVSGTLAAVQPDGFFTVWTLLKCGESIIPVASTDAASNSTTITRTVGYSPLFADFDYNCVINSSDIMIVAAKWRCRLGDECYNEDYDIDKDGDIDIVDIMLVVVHWGETC